MESANHITLPLDLVIYLLGFIYKVKYIQQLRKSSYRTGTRQIPILWNLFPFLRCNKIGVIFTGTLVNTWYITYNNYTVFFTREYEMLVIRESDLREIVEDLTNT